MMNSKVVKLIMLGLIATTSCKSEIKQDASLLENAPQGQNDNHAPYRFQRLDETNTLKELKAYRDPMIRNHQAYTYYYQDMFEAIWYANDGYSVELNTDDKVLIATQEAHRRFSQVDVGQLKAALLRESQTLEKLHHQLASQIGQKQSEMADYIAHHSDSKSWLASLGHLVSASAPKEHIPELSKKYQTLEGELNQLRSLHDEARIRKGLLKGVALSL